MVKYTECIVRMWDDDFTFSVSLVDETLHEQPHIIFTGKEALTNLEMYYGTAHLMEVTGPGVSLVGEYTPRRHNSDSFALWKS